ncbi:MAG: tetratricopeptide repeat protein, partial [Planctomycetota bacterium]
SIKWAFTTGYATNWHPVTWLSHMLDYQLFALKAGGHHLVNLGFHIANALLLFIVLKQMTSALWASAFVAALFAIHPLHIESVAWVAERKDVLSTFFWLLTMWAYAYYSRRPNFGRYLLVFIAFALGIMAKPMLVTLPLVLLLLDYWPLDRMDLSRPRTALFLLLEKLPLFLVAAASCIVTFFVQRAGGAVSGMENFGIKVRLFNTAISYVGYIQKMFWPSGLAVLYPHPGNNISAITAAICAAVFVLITVCMLVLGRKRKYLTVGWLWYFITLIPVIGLVQVGAQAMADRYTYIPLTGLFIIISWLGREIVLKRPKLKNIVTSLAVVILLVLAVCTSMQLKYWRNSEALFARTLAVTQGNYLIYNNYGNILKSKGRYDEAIEVYNKALKLAPKNPDVYTNLANTFADTDQVEEAIGCYRKAIELMKNKQMTEDRRYNLGMAYCRLGSTLGQLDRLDEAVGYFRKAIEVRPRLVLAHGQLGIMLARAGKFDEAIKEVQYVLKRKPNDFEMHCNLGILYGMKGQTDKAIAQYRRALEINPDFEKAKGLLAAVWAEKQGR